MRYPWSPMPPEILRIMASHHPAVVGAATLKSWATNPDGIYNLSEENLASVLLTIQAVGRWLHSPRRVISISEYALFLLSSWEPRFHTLLAGGLEPWRQGLMLRFESLSPETVVYIEPGPGREVGVRYVVWCRGGPEEWGVVIGDRSEVDTEVALSRFDPLCEKLMGRTRLAHLSDGSRVDYGRIMRVAVNAMAALAADPEVIVGKRRAPKGRRRGRVGGVSRVSRLTLSLNGLNVVTRRWQAEKQTAEEKANNEPIEDRKAPCLHTVQPHMWRVWVNAPREGEKVLETRERTRKDGSVTTQFRVSRIRGKDGPFPRGGQLEPKAARMVTGVEDIGV